MNFDFCVFKVLQCTARRKIYIREFGSFCLQRGVIYSFAGLYEYVLSSH